MILNQYSGACRTFLLLTCTMNLLWLCCPTGAQGDGSVPEPSMQSYCNTPLFAASGLPSNLLLMIDNSASMYDLAYTDPSGYCLDNNYQIDKTYSGYFDPMSNYSYSFADARFVPGATLPSPPCGSSSCAASKDYLYLEMAGTKPDRTVSIFKASGNFLNWLSMSKIDIEKQVLTGGKFLPDLGGTTRGVLQGETRGCQGKRFVKMIDDEAQITFAVRGPVLTDPGFTFQTSRGGATTLEIYDKAYNRDACSKAVSAWINKDKAGLIAQSDACLDVKQEVAPLGGLMASAGAIYNRVMSDCYHYLVENTPMTADHILRDDCMERYHGIFGYGAELPLNALDGVCGNSVPSSSGSTIGFLGKCYAALTDEMRDGCIRIETTNYCNEIKNPYVTDPSSSANMTGTNANVPGFVLDAGISNLGKVAGSFNARVYLASPPTGLIQQFSNSINFGAMVFNANGAAGEECAVGKLPCVKHCSLDASRECSVDSDCADNSGPCVASSDGGRIISYINDPDSPLGDHGTGLIAAIDGVTANAWTPFAESFYNAIGYFANRTDLRLQVADFDTITKPAPSRSSCQGNHVLILSDGMSTADSNPSVEALASLYGAAANAATGKDSANACPVYEGSRSLDDLAWIAAHRNIKTFSTSSASTDVPVTKVQSVTTHVIFTGSSNGAPGECDPAVLMQHTAANGGGVYASASDPNALYGKFKAVLRQIAEGANSGADASILATGQGNGAVFLREQFYPTKSFDGGTTAASWIGEMQSLWYYIDPFIGGSAGAGSAIREDSDRDLTLNLKNDRVVQFQGNAASLFHDVNGDGIADGAPQSVSLDAVNALWRAGIGLWQRSAADRTIYTQTNGSALIRLSSLNTDSNAGLLQALDASEAQQITSYVTGEDSPSYRNRTIAIPKDIIPGVGPATHVWKLGDIISSTPQLQSSVALGGYHLPSPTGYNDASYRGFINSNGYQNRGMVYVGANDGMLHAFNLGKINAGGSGDQKATLTGSDAGQEQWAFIPKNALPYLKYLRDPNYKHLYYVDGKSTLLDASIGDTNSGACVKGSYWNCAKTKEIWRTVLIGGMGMGGASCDTGGDCVPTPISDPTNPSKRLGYSSYFALDVTDPDHPLLLWEFSNPGLGYSTTGPAVVRVGDPLLNGRWFAVFGSGPTGPLENGQFKGRTGKELQFFVVDLRTGNLVATIATGIANAFAGSLSGAAIDTDRRAGSYQDDALYVGYTQKGAGGTWTGGVLRLLTKENPDPNLWLKSTVIDGIGPVTSGIGRLQDRKSLKLWLYFGTGRYFFSQDDMQERRAIYGIKEPCYNYAVEGVVMRPDQLDPTCAASASGTLVNQTTTQHTLALTDPGWRIDLDSAQGPVGAERLITNPVSITGGAVFFPTFQPNLDPCLGDAYLWGVKYDTGGTIPDGSIQGKALIQLSTGSVQENGLTENLTDKGDRRGPAMPGKPGGVKVVSNSGLRPLKKIIHIQER